MGLTKDKREILVHVVADPDAWVEHALEVVGESAVVAKIEKWRPIYLQERVKPNYKNKAQKDAIDKIEADSKVLENVKIVKEKLIDQKSINLLREHALEIATAINDLDKITTVAGLRDWLKETLAITEKEEDGKTISLETLDNDSKGAI